MRMRLHVVFGESPTMSDKKGNPLVRIKATINSRRTVLPPSVKASLGGTLPARYAAFSVSVSTCT